MAFWFFVIGAFGVRGVTHRPEVKAKLHAMDPPLLRVPGTQISLNRADGTTPLAMRATVEHTKVLPESALILALETRKTVPHVRPSSGSR